MRSNKSLKRERSDGILKESKSSDDLKKYQECAKKLDECSKNLLRLCRQTNQGLYDDDVERAANEILKKEEAEAKRIAEELRIQRGVLNKVCGSNRNLQEGSSSRNLSSKSLRANSRKDLVYSEGSGKAAGFSEHSQKPGMGENPVLRCDVSMPCAPCSGGQGAEFTIHSCEPKLPSSSSIPREPRQPSYYGPHPPNDPSAASVYGAPYGPAGHSMRYTPEGGSVRSIRYGPCTDIETGQIYNGNQYQDSRHQGPPHIGGSEQYFRPIAESTRLKRGYTQPAWEPHQATVSPTDFCQSFQSGNPNASPHNEAFMVRARSQTTQLTSDGKCPIHIVITTQSEDSPTMQQQPPREPMLSDCDYNQPPKGVNDPESPSKPEGGSYLSKEDASRFLQCVLNCWNQINQKSEAPKETKADKDCSRLIEFCCNLSSKSDLKKRDRKKRDTPKSKTKESRCFVCSPVDCCEGDGHKKAERRSREKRKDWQAECQRMFKELRSYKKNKAKDQRETTSTGCDPDPCYEVYRDYAVSDPCKDYSNYLQDPYGGWSQQRATWNQPRGSEYPCSDQQPHWGSQVQGVGGAWSNPQGGGGAWNNPQTLICTEVNVSASNSPASSQTNLKTSSSDMDTSVLLAIAKAAINLSMEHQKGEGAQKDRGKNPFDDRDEEESSFCDMLESIFGQ